MRRVAPARRRDEGWFFRKRCGRPRSTTSHLLDRGYPARTSLTLAGDRYRLTAQERNVLFRGLATSAESESRRARIGCPGPAAIQARLATLAAGDGAAAKSVFVRSSDSVLVDKAPKVIDVALHVLRRNFPESSKIAMDLALLP